MATVSVAVVDGRTTGLERQHPQSLRRRASYAYLIGGGSRNDDAGRDDSRCSRNRSFSPKPISGAFPTARSGDYLWAFNPCVAVARQRARSDLEFPILRSRSRLACNMQLDALSSEYSGYG